MKICIKCGQSKLLSDFYTDKTKVDKKRPRCKSCENEHAKITRNNPQYIYTFNKYQKIWQRKYRLTDKYKLWRKKALEKQSIKAQALKKQVVERYGGKCACCGIDQLCFLSIDHINNDGYIERGTKKNRPSGYFMYKKIIAKGFPQDLQVYCFNCNIAKQHNGGECPHKKNEVVQHSY